MIVESLQLLLGFEFDEKELKKFDESVQTINKSIVALGASVLASATAITAMTLSSSRSAVDMLKLSSATGTAVENLEALEYVSAQNSIQSSTLSGALESVRNNIAGISKGSGSALEAFSMLGISAFGADGKLRDSYETMKEATQKLSEMTNATRQAEYAQQIFGGSASEMLFMIRKGSQAFTDGEIAMKKYGSALTAEQLENVSKFSQSWDTLSNSFSQFTDLVWSQLAPAMNDLIKGFLEWWAINRQIITDNAIRYYKAFSNIVLDLIKYFWILIKAVTKVVEVFGGFEKVLRLVFWAFTAIMALKFLSFLGTVVMMAKTVGSALMAMNLKAMLIPVLIGVAIAIAYVIIDDFIAFMQGRNSVLGLILGEWGETFKKGFAKWQKIVDDAMVFWATNGFVDGMKKGFDGAKILFDKFIKDIGEWYDGIVKIAVDKATEVKDAILKPFKDAFEWVTNHPLYTGFMAGLNRTIDAMPSFDGSQYQNRSYRDDSSTTKTLNSNPIFNINTQTGGVANSVVGGYNSSLNQTFAEFSSSYGD